MKIGIIAGNRSFPVILANQIRNKYKEANITAICFLEETNRKIKQYVDKIYWLKLGKLQSLREAIVKEGIKEWILAGQITPLRIFNRKNWDNELTTLVEKTADFRPHTIFSEIIKYLEIEGIKFIDSTYYLKDFFSGQGILNNQILDDKTKRDIDFGLNIISRYVELDVGQTIVVKDRTVLALEGLEGTDNTILRGYRLGGQGCTILKFSKINQDLRFDVPLVGLGTLQRLRGIKAKALVLEAGGVLILEKEKFLDLSKKSNIAIVGSPRNK